MNIPFNKPYITGNELRYIEDVFTQNQFYGVGKYTQLCTDLIRDRVSARSVLLTDSCTSALEIVALLLRDKSKKQEVILPSYTFSSTASAFARAGFDPVFVEVHPDTLMIDPIYCERAVTEHTAAIVAVHYGSHPAPVHELKEISERCGCYFIEDAAQAFGSKLGDKSLGTFGDFGTFSFHETKNLHAGLSGALLINNPNFVDRARHIWERGTNRQEVLKGLVDKYSWVELGGSFYPTELQAAFLFAQLQSFETSTQQRKAIFDAYDRGLSSLKQKGDLWFAPLPEGFDSNYHSFWIRFSSVEECDHVRLALKQAGVAAYIGYVPLHSSKVGKSLGFNDGDLPITESLAERVLRLPFYNTLSMSDIDYVCTHVIKAIENDQ